MECNSEDCFLCFCIYLPCSLGSHFSVAVTQLHNAKKPHPVISLVSEEQKPLKSVSKNAFLSVQHKGHCEEKS